MIVRRFAAGLLFFVLAAPALAAVPRSSPVQQPVRVIPENGGERVLARASSEQGPAPTPSPAASGAPSPPPSTSPAAAPAEVTTKAREEFDHDRSGKLDRTRYGPELNGAITDALYAQVSAQLQSLGEVKRFTPVSQSKTQRITVYVYRIECAKPPAVEQTIGWDATGRILLLAYRPARG